MNFCDATAAYCIGHPSAGDGAIDEQRNGVAEASSRIGSNSYKAVLVGTSYGGFSSSSASHMTVTAGKYPTATTITQGGTAGNYTLTATVTGVAAKEGLASPTGTVSFLDTSNGNAVLGTAGLGAGANGLNWRNSQTPPVESYPADSVAAGDFNGDGIPDLAVPNNPASGGSGTVTILLTAATGRSRRQP